MSADSLTAVGELQAVLLATGENKRLGPLTEILPPALVPVGARLS